MTAEVKQSIFETVALIGRRNCVFSQGITEAVARMVNGQSSFFGDNGNNIFTSALSGRVTAQ